MNLLVWAIFLVAIVALILLDLGVFHRRSREASLRESMIWTGVWIMLALAFTPIVYWLYEPAAGGAAAAATASGGSEAAMQFLTAYVLEKSLSLDNIFIIAMILTYFAIPREHQHQLLFWGILGAVALRGVMIGLGAVLIDRLHWVHYVFGVLLLLSAVKMLITRHDRMDPEKNLMVRIARRVFAVSDDRTTGRFFVRAGGRLVMTPMFLALLLIETSDVMFAVDSIPAVFAVTSDPFLVFTSNIFAVLGLRSLYFVLSGFMERFRYLKASLAFILVYVGIKMLLSHHYEIDHVVSLSVIGGILFVGVAASIVSPPSPKLGRGAESRLPGEG